METVSKLRFWCYKILPLVYDDSLSYYEAICKATQKLNEVIGNVNELPDYINKEIAEQIGNNGDLFERLFAKIIKAVASCIDDAEFTSDEKFGGEIFWHNGELVECVKHMAVGTNYVIGTNIEVVNIIDLLNDIKGYISTNTEKYNERADREIKTGEYLFWKNKFLKAKQDIANDTVLTDDMFDEVCIGDELKLETDTRVAEVARLDNKRDTEVARLDKKIDDDVENLQTQITSNDGDIMTLQQKDVELKQNIDANDTNVNNRISNIIAQSGDSNTEIVDARKWSSKLGEKTSATIGDAIREQIGRSVNAIWASWTDANTFEPNSIHAVTSTGVVNLPLTPFNGLVVTLCGNPTIAGNINSAILQLALSASGNIYYRYNWTGAKWENWLTLTDSNNMKNILMRVARISGNAPWDDANTFDVNTIHAVTSTIQNVPDGFNGLVLTFCGNPALIGNAYSAYTQIAISYKQKIYYRINWGGIKWSSWETILQESDTIDKLMRVARISSEGVWGDANTFEVNTIHPVTAPNIANVPDGFNGLVLTFCGNPALIGSAYSAKVQLAFKYDELIYYRINWDGNAWKPWKQIDEPQKPYSPALPVLSCYNSIVCCGDSLTYSQVYTSDTSSRQAKVPYPIALGKITGVNTSYLATAGFSTKQWWDKHSEDIVATENGCAIIYLGTNYGLTDTLDIDAPEYNDYNSWNHEDNTGCYASIVSKYKSVGYNVILLMPYLTGGGASLADTKKVIKQCADRFQCGLIELEKLTDPKYHYYPDLSGSNNLHFNDLGYSAFANYLNNKIGEMSDDYMKFIIPK